MVPKVAVPAAPKVLAAEPKEAPDTVPVRTAPLAPNLEHLDILQAVPERLDTLLEVLDIRLVFLLRLDILKACLERLDTHLVLLGNQDIHQLRMVRQVRMGHQVPMDRLRKVTQVQVPNHVREVTARNRFNRCNIRLRGKVCKDTHLVHLRVLRLARLPARRNL